MRKRPFKYAYTKDGAEVGITRLEAAILNVVFWRHSNHPRTYATAKRSVVKKWGKVSEEGLFDFRACQSLVKKGLARVVREDRGRYSANLVIEINEGVRFAA